MSRLKQLYLSASSDQTLTVVMPARRIFEGVEITAKLPDEVLAYVFEYLVPQDWQERKTIRPLLFISRRWRRLFEPFHYRCIDLGYEGFDKRIRLTRLMRTLRDRPDLCKYVQRVPIALWKAEWPNCQMVSEFLGYCSQTRSISMHLNWTKTILILDRIPSLRRLTTLILSGYSCGPSLMAFSKVIQLPLLKNLKLSRYGAGRPGDPDAGWPEGVFASPSYLEAILPANRYRTGSITKLDLSDPSCSPEVSILIANWPRHLEEFNFTDIHHSRYGGEYTAATVQQLFTAHHKSLKHIKLGIFGNGSETINPNFSGFTALETLHLSKYTLLREDPETAMSKLASISLQSLYISFSPEDQHSESLGDWGLEETRWFTRFATAKAAIPQAGLKEVYVSYWPEIYPGCYSLPEDCPWPIDYMTEAQSAFKSHGLEMIIGSSVKGTKQEWIDRLKAHCDTE